MFETTTQTWNPEHIVTLRRRLGWSKSDLARRLHCETTEVEAWEQGSPVTTAVQGLLEVISRQADACFDEVKYSPVAECELDKTSLSQIDFSKFKEEFE
jgi:transcriptional regulator with XRE-family HTH domain